MNHNLKDSNSENSVFKDESNEKPIFKDIPQEISPEKPKRKFMPVKEKPSGQKMGCGMAILLIIISLIISAAHDWLIERWFAPSPPFDISALHSSAIYSSFRDNHNNNVPVKPIEGFAYYVNDEYEFRVQYPEHWEFFDNTMGDTVVEWIDDNTFEFASDVKLRVFYIDGMTQDEMRSPESMAESAEIVKERVNGWRSVYDSVEYILELNGKDLKNNYFVYYAVCLKYGDSKVYAYHALTVINGNVFEFLFNSSVKPIEDSIKIYEKMLSSLESTRG
jgi:hypothetical protein